MKLQKEYLKLASDWLLARLILMGGIVPHVHGIYSLMDWQVAELSIEGEMRLLLNEIRIKHT